MLGINRKYVSGYSSVDDISITQETKIVKKKKVIKKLIVAKFYTGTGYQRDSSMFYLGASYQRDSSIFYLGASYQRNFNSAAIPCRNHQKRLSPVTGAAFPAPGRAPISCQSLRLALTGSNMKLCGSS